MRLVGPNIAPLLRARASRAAWLLILALVLTACGASARAGAGVGVGSPPAAQATAVTATRIGTGATAAAMPAACSEAGLQQLVRRFLTAYNQGDQASLAAFFPAKSVHYLQSFNIPKENDAFLKFTVNTRAGPAFGTDDPRELPAYFAQRHQHREHLQLLRMEVQHAENPSLVAFFLTRQADDEPEQILYGQGRINCERQWITAWAVTDAPTPAAAPASPTSYAR